MGRIRVVVLIGLTLSLVIYANSQTRRSRAGDLAAKAKAKQMLVDKLPDKVEGVELKDNTVRLKAGYKFVKQGNEVTVMARRAGGGGRGSGLGGTWSCGCSGAGASGGCNTVVIGSIMYCSSSGCTGSCDLTVVIDGVKSGVLMY